MIRTTLLVLLIACPACIRAPDVVLIDRKTALEQLAAGSYHRLEDELVEAGATAQPVALTQSELEAAGAGEQVSAEERDRSDAAELDDLLRRRCVGESLDGTIVATASTCTGRVDVAVRNRVTERVNRDRVQIWQELRTRGVGAGHERDLARVRSAWRQAHLRAVVCGGQIQLDDGKWAPKKC